jgi:hypothetical protein
MGGGRVMRRFAIVFKKTVYATEYITTKTKSEAKNIAQEMVAEDRSADGQDLNWTISSQYKVVIEELGEESHD